MVVAIFQFFTYETELGTLTSFINVEAFKINEKWLENA